jgi:hypothetical protein
LSLSSENPVSKFAVIFNLCRYRVVAKVGIRGLSAVGLCTLNQVDP